MEYREHGLMVDISGQDLKVTNEKPSGSARHVVEDSKQEKEMATLDQETRLMRAFAEIRQCSPKAMSTADRELFNVMMENIFRKHGVTPESYSQYVHLGTSGQLKRNG